MVTYLPEWLTAAVVLLTLLGEWVHARRIFRIRRLAFGPTGNAAVWTRLAPLIRALGLGLATWGFSSLLLVVEPQVHNSEAEELDQSKHLVLIVDVSPSMHLVDSGPEGDLSRRQRASEVLESLFSRIPMRQFKISLIGVYTDAKPLLEDSRDHEVVRHIMEEMPMFHAFKPGKTKLIEGVKLAVEMVESWEPGSTYLLLLSDGDTVPESGMPTLPASVAEMIVVGLGDATQGTFIDGHQSRQDVSTLRQISNRLRGTYHNGNQKHLTSQIVGQLVDQPDAEAGRPWTRREWAIAAALAGAGVLALLPILLHYGGTRFRPGTRVVAGVSEPARTG